MLGVQKGALVLPHPRALSPRAGPDVPGWAGSRVPHRAFPQGYFTHSLLYYGYYSNTTLNSPCASSPSMCPLAIPSLPYNMPLAYTSSVGVSFLITCVLLVYRWVGSTSGTAAFTQHWCSDTFLFLQHVLLFRGELPCRQLLAGPACQSVLCLGLQGGPEALSEAAV